MFAAVSKNIPLTRAERCFLGGPFIRENLVGNLPVELRHCLFAFEQAHGESHKLVDWNVLLSEATFSSVDSHQSQFSFNAVRFLMPVRLSDCEIDGTASFFHCVFDSSLLLGEISDLASTKTFSGGLIFYDCKFAGVVNVNKEGSYTQLTFDKCVFGSSFIAQKLRVNRVHSRKLSLAESIFEKKVQISAENLIEVAPAFEGATLKKGIDFGPFETVLDQKFFDQLYEEVLAALGLPENNDAAKQERHSAAKDQFDLELLRLIAGARVIRLASQSSGDKFSEAQLHALELAAYQRLSTTNAVSRRFACLYGLLSDYGCSLSKPIAWGGVLLLVSAFFYALLNEMSQSTSYLQHVDWPQVFHQLSRRDLLRVLESLRHVDFCEIGQALLYSLSRVIPVGPWQDLVFTDSILSTGKGVSISPSSWQKIVVVIVATLQSLFSAVFIFLFGLAARRKFQVG
jgi:hypothetical protein